MDNIHQLHGKFFNKELPLTVLRIHFQGNMKLHVHDFTELVFIESGRARHFAGDEAYPVSRGDVFVIKDGDAHGYDQTDKLVLINIIFRADELNLPLARLKRLAGYHALFSLEPRYRRQHQFGGRLRLSRKQATRASRILSFLEDELTEEDDGFEISAPSIMAQLMVYLSRCYSAMKHDTPQQIMRLGEVFSYIERNYTTEIELAQLEEMAHMSGSTLLRYFHDTVGMAPMEYVTSLRLEHAATLLQEQDLSITDVAFASGFRDSNYFARQFRKYRQCSPSAWRKRFS